MFESFFKEKLGPLVLRLAVGLACVYHGFQKIQADGGAAWTSGLSTTWQMAIAWSQFGAGLAILLGLYTRLAAGVIITLTVGTLFLWQGWYTFRLPLSTLEPYIMFTLVSMALLFGGAGELALDARGGGSKSSAGPARKKAAA
ncbi:MAG: DoxX family protein [Gemmataceae bacterium]